MASTELRRGDVVSLRHRGKWLALWVIAVETDRRGSYPVVKLLGKPTTQPRRVSLIKTSAAGDDCAMLFALKTRLSRTHRVVTFALPRGVRVKHPFACANDRKTLDALVG